MRTHIHQSKGQGPYCEDRDNRMPAAACMLVRFCPGWSGGACRFRGLLMTQHWLLLGASALPVRHAGVFGADRVLSSNGSHVL